MTTRSTTDGAGSWIISVLRIGALRIGAQRIGEPGHVAGRNLEAGCPLDPGDGQSSPGLGMR